MIRWHYKSSPDTMMAIFKQQVSHKVKKSFKEVNSISKLLNMNPLLQFSNIRDFVILSRNKLPDTHSIMYCIPLLFFRLTVFQTYQVLKYLWLFTSFSHVGGTELLCFIKASFPEKSQ